MTHRATRVFLVVLAFAAAAGAGYLLWTLGEREASTRSTARTFESSADRALLLIERFRAAQQSYVADGQGSEFWMKQVAEVVDQLDRAVTTLAGTTASTELQDGARATAGTIDELRKMDARAREWVRGGQGLMASDLIFTESLATSATLAERLATIRDRHRQLTEADAADIRQQQAYVLSAAAAVFLIVTLLLAPAVRPSTPQDTREALRALIGEPPLSAAVPRAEPMRAAMPVASVAAAPNPGDTPAIKDDSPRPNAPTPQPAPVDVPATARICSELARVLDPAALPGILAESASLLDARGLIVWVADRSGSSLFPMLAHGYPAAALSRMGSIHRDDDNATALAYRLSEDRIGAARNGDPGAIVTPIVTPEGCVGVLAAEVSGGGEENPDRRALAGILAAQLATLVTTLPAASEKIQAQG
jgi:hypothetical protein